MKDPIGGFNRLKNIALAQFPLCIRALNGARNLHRCGDFPAQLHQGCDFRRRLRSRHLGFVGVIDLLAGHVIGVDLRIGNQFRGRGQFRLNPPIDVESAPRPSHLRDGHHPQLTAVSVGRGIWIFDFFTRQGVGACDGEKFLSTVFRCRGAQNIHRRPGEARNIGQWDNRRGNTKNADDDNRDR